MSFMRRKPKLTKIDEDVRDEKNTITNEMLAPLRRESAAELKTDRRPMDPARMEALKGRHECLTIIDDIITAKLKHRPNKEIKLYDDLVEQCYEFYKSRIDTDTTETLRRGIINIIETHASNAGKASDKKSASMTSFASDMAVIIKAAIHRNESTKGKGSRKSQRKSLPIAVAQTQAKRMFDLKKGGHLLESSDEQEESTSESDSSRSQRSRGSSSNNNNSSP